MVLDFDVADAHEEYIDEPFDYTVSDVKEAMHELPEGYKLVFDLYIFEGLSHREIAERLDITDATSKSQLSRAKGRLKSILEQTKK